MNKLLDYTRRMLKVHSPTKEWPDIYKRKSNALNSIIPVDEDKQLVKISEGKSVIIQIDSMLKVETTELIKKYIQKQIEENGFAVVDGRCKIVEFDNPKFIIKTKCGDV